MRKYRTLKAYLAGQDSAVIALSFAGLEQILGFPLPASAAHPWWWASIEKAGSLTA
jgi:hypothetical protein